MHHICTLIPCTPHSNPAPELITRIHAPSAAPSRAKGAAQGFLGVALWDNEQMCMGLPRDAVRHEIGN